MSDTCTQSFPPFNVPESCGLAPAAVFVVPFGRIVHVVPSDVPTARPITMFAGGPAAVSVTVSRPPDNVIVKSCVTFFLTSSVPANRSVITGAGVVGNVTFESLLVWHAAAASRAIAGHTSGSARFIRPIVQSFGMIQLSNLMNTFGDRVLLE